MGPLQLNFHSPSEHTIEGKHHDLEMHIVHQYKGTNGQLGAVIAIFFDVEDGGDEENPFIKSLMFPEALPYSPPDNTVDPPIPEVLGFNITDVQLASLLTSIPMVNYWS